MTDQELRQRLEAANTEIQKLRKVLNDCSRVANALNPDDPMRVDLAHRALWDALETISKEWPIP